MAVNKVIYGGETLIDISNSTVTPETLAKGTVAYNAKGEQIAGTMESDNVILHGVTVTDNDGALTLDGLMVVSDEDGNLATQCGGGGVILPPLETPASASDMLAGKQLIDEDGSVVTGTMPTQTLPTPSISVSSGGLITATDTLSASGYVASGTKSATKQLTTQAAKTITPSTSSQTAVASGVYTTGAVTVAAIPSSYVKPSATKSATTYTPTTSNQTIAAGTYCSGAQTIKGDSNLVADNIKSGVSIFGVAGSYEGSGGGSSGGGESGGTIKTCDIQLDISELTFGYVESVYYTCFDEYHNRIEYKAIFDTNEVMENVLVSTAIVVVCSDVEFVGGPPASTGLTLEGVNSIYGLCGFIFTDHLGTYDGHYTFTVKAIDLY